MVATLQHRISKKATVCEHQDERTQVTLEVCSESNDDGGTWKFCLQDGSQDSSWSVEEFEPGLSGERLELFALVRALEAVDGPAQITLYCHSASICRRLRRGLDDWRESDWQWERFGEMTPVANADLWRRLDRALQIHQVTVRPTYSRWAEAPVVAKRTTATSPRRTSPVVAAARDSDGASRWEDALWRLLGSRPVSESLAT